DINPLHNVILHTDYKDKYYKNLIPLGLKYDEAWLLLMEQAVEETDVSQICLNREAQHKYLTWRTVKMPLSECLSDWHKSTGPNADNRQTGKQKRLVTPLVLHDAFSVPETGLSSEGSWLSSFEEVNRREHVKEYRCEDGTINEKRSMNGKSFETRPWDTGGEFVG
ncbi:hypothetical protein GIB67_030393, partial [Kingdonia uniflora]